ncbi:MAG: glycosyltransferase family 2 protein [Pseudomonadota bacterium]
MAGTAAELWLAYRLRWRRRKYLYRAWRKRAELTAVNFRLGDRPNHNILCFSTVRNELGRLPFWLAHHRALGVEHFLIVDNGSDDGTADLLARQPDVSLWRTEASYRRARFGVDWLNRLQHLYAPGRWALTLDADECLTYPEAETRRLPELCAWLERRGVASFGAMMLDLYPEGPIGAGHHAPEQPVWETLTHLDAWGYSWEYQPKFRNISIRGGPRKRVFFSETPDHAPHLHKVPLVRWRRGMAYASATHLALPRRLNDVFDARHGRPTGVLLHSKFLPEVIANAAEEKHRAEHFTHPDRYGAYYDRLAEGPSLLGPPSLRYEGPLQLEALGLMRRGAWPH